MSESSQWHKNWERENARKVAQTKVTTVVYLLIIIIINTDFKHGINKIFSNKCTDFSFGGINV